jgi:peroxiredoxin
MIGVTMRSAFVIDKNGTIQYAEILEDAGKQPNYDAIKACLEGLN